MSDGAPAKSRIPAYIEFSAADESLEAHCKRAPLSATPLAYFALLLTFATEQNKRNTQLEQRLAALENRPHLKFGGVHVPGRKYADATLVARDGLWLSLKETQSTPGGNADWQLVLRRGQR